MIDIPRISGREKKRKKSNTNLAQELLLNYEIQYKQYNNETW